MRIPGFARLLALSAALVLGVVSLVSAQSSAPRVRVDTSLGSFTVELDPQRAPLTVASFLEYAKAGFYTDTVFHRVIGNFVVQGGGFDTKYVEKPTRPATPNESGNGLSNRRGTVGLARTGEPHSGTAQFYVNLADNAALDPQPSRWGYTVFGRVIEGMNVVDDIGAVATGNVGPFDHDAPMQPIVIKRVEVLQ
ncbi:peptidylprolyl isomerase [Peristeroidobacter soli]|jgi:cyclophilin family peptidyl-prolyl cis-trans isomerase|uniref:peptidylprolyl isomerase n=1 Tax=Peristeroidobacter soli TaxID=2497877 RepID=UPI00101D26FB|nr:peptidylprolyl isomerase [Peristeroidobacter soli]